MERTTIRLNPDLMRQLRHLAAETHRTLTSIIEDAIREVLAQRKVKGTRAPVKIPTFRGGGGLLPGIDLNNSASVWDAMDNPNDPYRR